MNFSLRGFLLACALSTLSLTCLAAEPSVINDPRQLVKLNDGWRFLGADDPRASESDFDDAGWQTINLPHTWNALDGQDGGGNYRRGAGWYRLHFRVDPAFSGRRLYLQFDGVSLAAKIFVNGLPLGTHRGGFARFRFDATEALHPNADNVVSVRVDNGQLGIPPISADFTFFGGIYRAASLLATDPVQITTMDYASSGLFLTPQQVTVEKANLEIRVGIDNHESAAYEAEVISTLLDAQGTAVQSTSSKHSLAPGAHLKVTQTMIVLRPHLWNGRSDPYLYHGRVELKTDSILRDMVEQPVGFRFFRVDPEKGFFLNGRLFDLHGVNRHQDRVDKGWAISMADEAEDFAMIEEIGATAIRVAHYQQSETWYGRADRAGLAIWAEIPFVNDASANPEFLANAKDQLHELILQNYNHPSIFFWGVGNETKNAPADNIITELAAIVRKEDPSRLSTYASDHTSEDPKNWHTDVVAFNRYDGWYSGEFTHFGSFLDDTHRKHSQKGIGVSEYGAGASIAQHEENPSKRPANSPRHPEEYQNKYHEAAWKTLKDRPYIWGKFIWNMFDFASDGRSEGDHPGRNDKGLVTFDRKTRKDSFFFYKANWSTEPVIYVTSRRFVERDHPVTEAKVYSNADDVELTVNGRSLGQKKEADHIFRWTDVHLQTGPNQIVATGHFAEQSITDSCTWNYAPALPLPTVRPDPREKP